MKKLIKLFILITVSLIFLTGCFFGGLSGANQGSLIISPSRAGENNTKAFYRSRDVQGQCEDSNDCIDICEDTYGEFSDSDEENEGRVERCLELSYSAVDSFEMIVEALEDPAFSKFQNIDSGDFVDFLNVSLRPWIEYIEQMRQTESEIVLRWIASEKRVAKGIISAYQNYEDIDQYDGVYKMLLDLAPDLSDNYPGDSPQDRMEKNCAELCVAILEHSITGNKSFADVSYETRNNDAMDIAEELRKDVCPADYATTIAECSNI